MRNLFGKPIRNSTTLDFYPDKLILKEFCEDIKGSIDIFEKNMKDLDRAEIPLYVEEWLETFAAWMEIEEER